MTLADRALAPAGPELRSYSAEFEVRSVPGAPARTEIQGYASLFDSPYQVADMFGEYAETVQRGAFTRTLSANPSVVLLDNHGGLALASTASGSLRLTQDSRGLLTVAQLNTTRSDARDLLAAIEDRDISQMSFAFRVFPDGQQWSTDYMSRTLLDLDLDRGDVSCVNFAANPATNVALRRSSTAPPVPLGPGVALLRRRLAAGHR